MVEVLAIDLRLRASKEQAADIGSRNGQRLRRVVALDEGQPPADDVEADWTGAAIIRSK